MRTFRTRNVFSRSSREVNHNQRAAFHRFADFVQSSHLKMVDFYVDRYFFFRKIYSHERWNKNNFEKDIFEQLFSTKRIISNNEVWLWEFQVFDWHYSTFSQDILVPKKLRQRTVKNLNQAYCAILYCQKFGIIVKKFISLLSMFCH